MVDISRLVWLKWFLNEQTELGRFHSGLWNEMEQWIILGSEAFEGMALAGKGQNQNVWCIYI